MTEHVTLPCPGECERPAADDRAGHGRQGGAPAPLPQGGGGGGEEHHPGQYSHSGHGDDDDDTDLLLPDHGVRLLLLPPVRAAAGAQAHSALSGPGRIS